MEFFRRQRRQKLPFKIVHDRLDGTSTEIVNLYESDKFKICIDDRVVLMIEIRNGIIRVIQTIPLVILDDDVEEWYHKNYTPRTKDK